MSGQVYFIEADGLDCIKIGFTSEDVWTRMGMLQVGCPRKLTMLGAIPGTTATEKRLHRQFSEDWVRGEWFRSSDELSDFIRENASIPLRQHDLKISITLSGERLRMANELRAWLSEGKPKLVSYQVVFAYCVRELAQRIRSNTAETCMVSE